MHNHQDLTILGFDPGSQVAGFGLVQISPQGLRHLTHGTINLNPRMDFSGRLLEIGKAVQNLLLTHRPSELSIEQVFLGRNPDSAFKLGHVRGVVIYEAKAFGCHVSEYATRSVKKSITGHGGAEKDEVRWILQRLLRTGPISSLDASDALALACHHAHELHRKRLLERALQI